MATSKRQLEANRRNASRSTGPVTAEGKAIARRNATTHGLYACDIVINSPHLKEDRAQYDHLVRSLIEELRPEGVLQEHLVLKIANCLWRYRRAINAETAQINRQLQSSSLDLLPLTLLERGCDDPDYPPEDDHNETRRDANLIGARSIPTGSFRLNLMHYEMRLDRQLTRAYQLLRHLQLMNDAKRLSNRHRETENTQNEPITPQITDSSSLDPT